MRRALELAKLGMGSASPNPMVGCVIVHDGKIIGEGYHKKYGEAHAEVNAVASVDDQSLLSESTAYVTLEPCSFFGNTPPCADLLITKKLKRVVVCGNDPHPRVSGKGIEKLKSAGIEVKSGFLEEEGLEVNKRFFTFYKEKRPYIILKWAQTSDGFVARENFDSKWISNQYSRQLVHKWRTEEDAIMVGTNTARYDDPSLTARDWKGGNPTRIVMDRNLALPSDLKLFDEEVETLVFTERAKEDQKNITYIQLPKLSPKQILDELYKRRIHSVLIEGGSTLLNAFLKENFWDEARVFTANTEFGKGIAAPEIHGRPSVEEDIDGDKLETFLNN
ncbi:MAG: bifunctional diaminohydroxyphosphoribosylaminopyrimidine deaminase/5-amino-6-(5-phosphoribosylamino)uracil reductase RibD [Cyclobacteriaceae bacterium]